MPGRFVRQVVYQNGQWLVTFENNDRVESVHKVKLLAVLAATDAALRAWKVLNQLGQVNIHATDGRLEEQRSYGGVPQR
jgi:hypothetical protein